MIFRHIIAIEFRFGAITFFINDAIGSFKKVSKVNPIPLKHLVESNAGLTGSCRL